MFGRAILKLGVRRDTFVYIVQGKRGKEKRMTYKVQNMTTCYDCKPAVNST